MLHAIGIYEKVDNRDNDKDNAANTKKLIKVQSSEKNQQTPLISLNLFSPQSASENDLKNVDELLLKSNFYGAEMIAGKLYKFKVGAGEINYLFQPVSQKFVIAISSKKELDPYEKGFLFKNIEHVFLRPQAVKTTLSDIIANPLGYTGRDLLIGHIDDEIEEVMAVMHDNIEKVIKRGEALDELESKALNLSEHAIEFKKSAERLNEGCCGATARYVYPW